MFDFYLIFFGRYFNFPKQKPRASTAGPGVLFTIGFFSGLKRLRPEKNEGSSEKERRCGLTYISDRSGEQIHFQHLPGFYGLGLC